MNKNLIAPCGMNCAICVGFLREKNNCPGCRIRDAYQFGCGRKCIIRNCAVLKQKKMKFCSCKCEKYSCKRLKALDKRYRTKYGMSMIENLEFIDKKGIRKFLKNEEGKWTRKGKTLCVHNKKLY